MGIWLKESLAVFEGVFVETDEMIEAAKDTADLFSDESSKAFLDSSDIFVPFTSLIFFSRKPGALISSTVRNLNRGRGLTLVASG